MRTCADDQSGEPDDFGGGSGAEGLEQILGGALALQDEVRFGPTWRQATEHVRELTLRPAKRLRPRLLQLGFELVGQGPPPAALARFAAGLELLHTFMLVHDDVADRSNQRRGGAALHATLGCHGSGEDLAVVAGDHLFARALELMLSTPLPGAPRASEYFLGVCRHTAVGQYLDLALSSRALGSVTVVEAIRVADLKTARYSFGAPLACGALLAGAPSGAIRALERMGRFAGLAFQFRDDLEGIYGETAVEGKPGGGDLEGNKRTLPILAAWRRAAPKERAVLEALGPSLTPLQQEGAREVILRRGGVAVTERAIGRTLRASLRALASQAPESPVRVSLARLFEDLSSGRPSCVRD